jgi:serine/threonine protein kinase
MRAPGDRFGDLILVDMVLSEPAGTLWVARQGPTTCVLWVPSELRPVDDVPHPAVAPVVRRVLDGGTEGAVLGFSPGPSLQDVLRQGRVDRASAQRWALTLARALAAGHASGVVHGALSARRVRVEGSEVRLWGFGTGPDPLVPDPGGGPAPTAASDVHAWGSLVYELLTGAPPFPGTARERAARAATGAHQPLALVCPELPDELAALLYAALSPDPRNRPPLPTSFAAPWPDTAETLGRPSPPTIVAFDKSQSESEVEAAKAPPPPVPPAGRQLIKVTYTPPAPSPPTMPLPEPYDGEDPFPQPWLRALAIVTTIATCVLVLMMVLLAI